MTWMSNRIIATSLLCLSLNTRMAYAEALDFIYEGYTYSSFSRPLTQEQIEQGIRNNNPQALTAKGYQYHHGSDDIEQDYKQAMYWFRKASGLGDRQADYAIGFAHYYGLGATKNIQSSHQYFLKSARKGFPPALHFMARWRLVGFSNTPQRCQDAMNWLYRASRSKYAIAQAQIADAFKQGICVRPNIKQARYYYNQALRNVKDDKIKSTILEQYSKL